MSLLLKMANESWNKNLILPSWKLAKMIMIPKGDSIRSNPHNYRPISLTNSIIKLFEKLAQPRLDKFILNHNLIDPLQSGFQKNRSTMDNLIYLAEKIYRAQDSNSKNKVCGVVFDISKAFDKVWHKGLIYKLHMLKLPRKLGDWLVNLITNRKFYVTHGGFTSDVFPIETGVHQGGILSPILFILYINDIFKLINYPNQDIEELMFADDLFAFTITDTCIRRLMLRMNRFLKALEVWLNTWRLVMAAHKCSFSIYLGNVPILIANKKLHLKM